MTAPFDTLVLLRVHQIQDVYQWRSFRLDILFISVLITYIISIIFQILSILLTILHLLIRLHLFLPLPLPPALSPLLPRLLFGTRILMQKEYRPILTPHVRLIRQHQLSQHMLISTDRARILMLHHTPPINVETGNQDVFDMILQ
jgi:hypothetical protein